MEYTVSGIAKIMDVESSTIRYYDQMGLLPNVKRRNGRRIFTDEDFKWLRVLKCMKRINMPIKKIQEYIKLAQVGDETLSQRYQIILEQKKAIEKEIADLQNCYKEFEYKEWYYKTAIEAGTEKVVENIPSNEPTLDIDIIPSKGERK